MGIVQNLYYRWSKDFLEAGKKRLAGDTARAATSDEVKDLRREERTWARFSPQIMRGIMRAVGAIMRSPNMGDYALDKYAS